MNNYPIKIKATLNQKTSLVKIKTRLNHPMETGLRKDDQGVIIPMLFIQEIHILLNDTQIMHIDSNSSFAKNPNFNITLSARSEAKIGDKITIMWVDSQKNTQSENSFIVADEESELLLRKRNRNVAKNESKGSKELKGLKNIKNSGSFKLNGFK